MSLSALRLQSQRLIQVWHWRAMLMLGQFKEIHRVADTSTSEACVRQHRWLIGVVPVFTDCRLMFLEYRWRACLKWKSWLKVFSEILASIIVVFNMYYNCRTCAFSLYRKHRHGLTTSRPETRGTKGTVVRWRCHAPCASTSETNSSSVIAARRL